MRWGESPGADVVHDAIDRHSRTLDFRPSTAIDDDVSHEMIVHKTGTVADGVYKPSPGIEQRNLGLANAR